MFSKVVLTAGIEPARPKARRFECRVSAYFTRSASRAKREDRTRHLLLVTQPAHHLPCFALVHRQGVEPWCADLSGPATYPRRGALVRRSGIEPVTQAYKVPFPHLRPADGARPRISTETLPGLNRLPLAIGLDARGRRPRNRTELGAV